MSWTGRTDTNKRVVFPSSLSSSPVLYGLSREEAMLFAALPVAWKEQGKGKEVEVEGVEGSEGGSVSLVQEGKEVRGEKEEDVEVVGDKIQLHMGSAVPMRGSAKGSGRGSVPVDVSEGLDAVAMLVRSIEEQRERERGRERGSVGDDEAVIEVEREVKEVEKGTYVVVKILSARGHTLRSVSRSSTCLTDTQNEQMNTSNNWLMSSLIYVVCVCMYYVCVCVCVCLCEYVWIVLFTLFLFHLMSTTPSLSRSSLQYLPFFLPPPFLSSLILLSRSLSFLNINHQHNLFFIYLSSDLFIYFTNLSSFTFYFYYFSLHRLVVLLFYCFIVCAEGLQ